MPGKSWNEMSPEEQIAHREFWISWVERAQREIGTLLAETLEVSPSGSPSVEECVDILIDVEQQLTDALDPYPVSKPWRKKK